MSASQDKSQKPKFASSNVLQLFKEAKPSLKPNQNPSVEVASSQPAFKKIRTGVIKAEDLKKESPDSIQIQKYLPTEMLGKRIARRPDSIPAASVPTLAMASLKQNLKTLNDLQGRLRFLLKELDELIHD